MASKAEKLIASLGANMAESMGAGAGGASPPEHAPGGASPGSTPGTGAASKHDGVKPLREARTIRLENLARDPDQPRQFFDSESLDRLALSLRQRGQLQPIRVRWRQELGKYVIVAGERRWRAALLAGLDALHAVVVEHDQTNSQVLQDQLVENCLREDLHALDQAAAFRALMDANGWSARRVAEELHLANSTVVKALSLLSLDSLVRGQVESGALAPSAAYELSKLPAQEDQIDVAEQIISGNLNRDEATAAVRARAGRPPKAKAQTPPKKPERKVEFRLEDDSLVTVTGPAAGAGPAAVYMALEAALEQLNPGTKPKREHAA